MRFIKKYMDKMFGRMVDNMYTVENLKRYNDEATIRKIEDIYEGAPYWLDGDMKATNKAKSALSILANKITLEFQSEIVPKKKSNGSLKQIKFGYEHLVSRSRFYIEQLLAYGYGAFKVFNSNGKIGVEFVTGDKILPLKFDDFGELCEAIFITRVKIENKIYSKLEHHDFSYGEHYRITSTIHEGMGIGFNGKPTNQITNVELTPMWKNALASLDLNVNNGDILPETPFFVYVKTPKASLDNTEVLGYGSLILAAEAHLSSYDYMYNRYLNEFEIKKPKIMIPEDMVDNGPVRGVPRSQMGVQQKYVQPSRREIEFDKDIYVQYPSGRSDKSEISIFSPSIENASIESALDFFLREIEDAVGLAFGELSKSTAIAKTATEIEASKERSYSTIVDYQDIIRDSYEKIVSIMIYRAELSGAEPLTDYEVTFYFDDSIAMDRRDNQRALAEVSAGIISHEAYLMKTRGITYEQAYEEKYGVPMEKTEKAQKENSVDQEVLEEKNKETEEI